MQEITNFFNTEYTFTLSGLGLTIIATLFTVGLVSMLFAIMKLVQRINDSQKLKYGFLGKPLYQFFLFALLIGGSLGAVYIASQEGEFQNTGAFQKLGADLKTQRISETNSVVKTNFDVIPLINEKPWGDSDAKFDIYVNIDGPKNVVKVMQKVNQSSKASFVEDLPKGKYKVKITVITDTDYKSFEKELTIN